MTPHDSTAPQVMGSRGQDSTADSTPKLDGKSSDAGAVLIFGYFWAPSAEPKASCCVDIIRACRDPWDPVGLARWNVLDPLDL